jgi:hypothetical protein
VSSRWRHRKLEGMVRYRTLSNPGDIEQRLDYALL